MNSSRDKTSIILIKMFLKVGAFISIIFSGVLSLVYYYLWIWNPPVKTLGDAFRSYSLSIITNLIPVFIIFSASYFLFKEFQETKEKQEREQLVNEIVERNNLIITGSLKSKEDNLSLMSWIVTDLLGNEAVGRSYQEAAKLVSQADNEILMLTYFTKNDKGEDDYPRNESYKRERDFYYDVLYRKCLQHPKDTLFFTRIVQVEEFQKTDDISRKMLSSYMERHFEAILGIWRKHHEAVEIKKAPIFINQSFMLIDQRFILWELSPVDPEKKSSYFEGMIVFDDKDKIILNYLYQFFMRVYNNSITVTHVSS